MVHTLARVAIAAVALNAAVSLAYQDIDARDIEQDVSTFERRHYTRRELEDMVADLQRRVVPPPAASTSAAPAAPATAAPVRRAYGFQRRAVPAAAPAQAPAPASAPAPAPSAPPAVRRGLYDYEDLEARDYEDLDARDYEGMVRREPPEGADASASTPGPADTPATPPAATHTLKAHKVKKGRSASAPASSTPSVGRRGFYAYEDLKARDYEDLDARDYEDMVRRDEDGTGAAPGSGTTDPSASPTPALPSSTSSNPTGNPTSTQSHQKGQSKHHPKHSTSPPPSRREIGDFELNELD